jgi:hypothetical protein
MDYVLPPQDCASLMLLFDRRGLLTKPLTPDQRAVLMESLLQDTADPPESQRHTRRLKFTRVGACRSFA